MTKKGGELVEFITDDKRNVGCDLLLRQMKGNYCVFLEKNIEEIHYLKNPK